MIIFLTDSMMPVFVVGGNMEENYSNDEHSVRSIIIIRKKGYNRETQ